MPESKSLSMLGIARRAGKLSMGHDMAKQALQKQKASLLLFTADASPRLENEFKNLIQKHNIKITVLKIAYTMDEIHFGVGYRAGVITVNDENLSKRINELLIQEANANGN